MDTDSDARDDDSRPAWESEYAAWRAEQDDTDEINRLLHEAEEQHANQ